jgi:hypothetical protein
MSPPKRASLGIRRASPSPPLKIDSLIVLLRLARLFVDISMSDKKPPLASSLWSISPDCSISDFYSPFLSHLLQLKVEEVAPPVEAVAVLEEGEHQPAETTTATTTSPTGTMMSRLLRLFEDEGGGEVEAPRLLVAEAPLEVEEEPLPLLTMKGSDFDLEEAGQFGGGVLHRRRMRVMTVSPSFSFLTPSLSKRRRPLADVFHIVRPRLSSSGTSTSTSPSNRSPRRRRRRVRERRRSRRSSASMRLSTTRRPAHGHARDGEQGSKVLVLCEAEGRRGLRVLCQSLRMLSASVWSSSDEAEGHRLTFAFVSLVCVGQEFCGPAAGGSRGGRGAAAGTRSGVRFLSPLFFRPRPPLKRS